MTYRYSDGGHEDPRLAKAVNNTNWPAPQAPVLPDPEPIQAERQAHVTTHHSTPSIPQAESIKSFFDIQLEMLSMLFEMIGSSDAGQSQFALSQVDVIYASIVEFQKTKSGHYKPYDFRSDVSASNANQAQGNELPRSINAPHNMDAPFYFRVAGINSPAVPWHPESAPPQ